jgi:hypothetical protein
VVFNVYIQFSKILFFGRYYAGGITMAKNPTQDSSKSAKATEKKEKKPNKVFIKR